jgi:hypothetical protein
VEDRDFDPRLPTIEMIPNYYSMALEVQNWEVPGNRKRLNEFFLNGILLLKKSVFLTHP